MRVGEGLQLVHQPLGMDPAQRVLADVELPGIVADDDGLAQEAVLGHGAPERALGGDADRVGRHRQPGEAEMLEMALPGRLVGEAAAAGALANRWITGPARARSRMYSSAASLTT